MKARRTRRNATEIFSIFGQIESVAAQVMIDRGEATKIDAEQIPESALFNKLGDRAKFAVMMPGARVQAFEQLIRELRR